MAAWMVIAGSVIVVLTVFDQVGSLRSLESRNAIQDFLSEPPGSGMGLDVEGVIAILHITSMVAAGCATAAAILGWHVLKRNLHARVALSIVAVPLFVSGLVAGGFVSSLVVAAAAMLWLQPAREWFKTGRWTPPAPREKSSSASSIFQAGGTDKPTTDEGPSGSLDQPTQPPPSTTPYGQPHHLPARGLDSARSAATAGPLPPRPRALVVAFVLTAVFASLTVLLATMSVVAMLVAPELVMDELERQRPDLADQGVTPALLRATTVVMAGFLATWSVVAIVIGAMAMTGREWARRGLMISAGATAGCCVMMALGAPFLLVPAAAALATLLNLRRPEVRDWFARLGPRQPHRP